MVSIALSQRLPPLPGSARQGSLCLDQRSHACSRAGCALQAASRHRQHSEVVYAACQSGESSSEWSDNGSNGNGAVDLPTQGQSVQRGAQTAVLDRGDQDSVREGGPNVDYLQELLAIQANGAKNIGFFGTRNMGFLHQKLIEILSYAMVLTGNHIFTSGGVGTNAAVIKGALRAERPDLLTVILPQSLGHQPEELHELLGQVQDLQCMEENDGLTLLEASQLCNARIISNVQQIICFAFHDSKVVLKTCQEAREKSVIVTLCYLD